jgi:hypothetical protein
VFSLLLSAAICFSVELNQEMVTYNNKPYYNLRALTTSALQKKLLSAVPIISDANPANSESFSADVIFSRNAPNAQKQNFLLKAKKYPSIVSTIDFIELIPKLCPQNFNLIANLVKVKMSGDVTNSSVKNIPDEDQIFLMDPVLVGDLGDGYVIFGKLNSANYNSNNQNIVVTSYDISNPRIFIKNKSGKFLAEITDDLHKRFAEKSLSLNIKTCSKPYCDELMIELPDHQYRVDSSR